MSPKPGELMLGWVGTHGRSRVRVTSKDPADLTSIQIKNPELNAFGNGS